MWFASPQILLLCTAVVAGTLLTACSAHQPIPKSFQQDAAQAYRLDSGDRLRITVFEQPNLTNSYTVDQTGHIAFPLIGKVPARGETLPALEGAIAGGLKRGGYLQDPDVTIEIDRYRPVFVMGEVGRPGQYSYVPAMTAQNAVAIAGGFTSRARHRDVDITRKVDGRSMTARVPLPTPVVAGDTIYVQERFF